MKRSILIATIIINLVQLNCLYSWAENSSGGSSDESLINNWKKERLTIEQIEKRTEMGWAVNKNDSNWKAFKSKVLDGDEIWAFSSPGPTWEKLMGWQGYAIFQNGKLVDTYTTIEN